ncbi:ArsI/CadI family heavy metal resistance metalloenzyme [Hylemonella sp. W303a]|uniref:ArsI/CadI family heavy metal resistance metalloenzyme n=1 Tax=Hylemonella sp. W303a TaxID=3389873 RepID=UPI00396AFFF8
MKRFHVHLHVQDLNQNINFYSTLFGQAPTRTESDYAKWMLQDPPVNFAISTRGTQTGLDHLGFQVESDEELQALKVRAKQAELAMHDEGETTCCYARSDKYWLTDPQGVAWEQFHTLDHIPTFSETTGAASSQATACCPPTAHAAPRGKPVGIAVKSTSSCC